MQARRVLVSGVVSVLVAAGCDLSPNGATERLAAELRHNQQEVAALRAEVRATREALAAVEAEVALQAEEVRGLRARAAAQGAQEGAAPPAEEAGRLAIEEAARAAIRCEGGRCTVARSLVQAMEAAPEAVLRQARVIPNVKDGKPSGFKLFGIRPGSVPALLGLKNGDVISGVNGRSLASPEAVMAAYSAERAAKRLVFTGERQGAALSLEVTLTE